MVKSIFCSFFLFSILSIATAQRVITGTVSESTTGLALPGAHIVQEKENRGTVTDPSGKFRITWDPGKGGLIFRFPGCESVSVTPGTKDTLDVILTFSGSLFQADTVITFDPEVYEEQIQIVRNDLNLQEALGGYFQVNAPQPPPGTPVWNTEDYSPIVENNEKDPFHEPLSTFSIDVDNAAYSNIRRYINQGQHPPADAVRIEEMINYFNYDYRKPRGKHPLTVSTELSDCPWNSERKLLLIGLQGKEVDYDKLPSSNLVFLIDVSGSMEADNKLPLVKLALGKLVEQLRPEDRVAIVVYAGAAGLILPPTSGDDPEMIRQAIDKLKAGGSTAGGAGIQLAYDTAKEHFVPGGNNRVILATDGDFNVGISSDGALTRLIEEKRRENIYLTVLGFGMGNYKDNKLELLADKGNGNYAYIDHLLEAEKVFVHDLRANLFTLARDVKIQLEFNPARVQSYRLVGYENRVLNQEDFNNDLKDAGEMGTGHQVTALYELTLRKENEPILPTAEVDPLRFQSHLFTQKAARGNELAVFKCRYKPLDKDESRLIEDIIRERINRPDQVSENFRTAVTAAGFGMMLRESAFNLDLDAFVLSEMARSLKPDQEGYRKELADLIEKWMALGTAD